MKSEEGSTLVVSAFFMIIYFMFAGLSIDGSRAFLGRVQMQTAADASALAGTHMLISGYAEADIEDEMQRLAALNGATAITWAYDLDHLEIQVSATKTIHTYFALIFDYHTITVSAQGSASAFAIQGLENLMPFTFRCSDVATMLPGQIYRFWDDDQIVSGNVGWLDWNGGSSSALELAEHIRFPILSGERIVGEWIDTAPGVKSSAGVRSALDEHIGDALFIPLFGAARGNGNNAEYQICGFARFILTEYNFQGQDKYIEGRFLLSTANGVPSSHPGFTLGLRTVRLTQ